MKRHALDLISLISGTVFLIIAVSYLSAAAIDSSVQLGWLVPAAFVAVGVAGLVSVLRGRAAGRESGAGSPGATSTEL